MKPVAAGVDCKKRLSENRMIRAVASAGLKIDPADCHVIHIFLSEEKPLPYPEKRNSSDDSA